MYYLIVLVFEGTCAPIDKHAIIMQRYNPTHLYNLSPSVVAMASIVITSLPNTPVLLGTPNIAAETLIWQQVHPIDLAELDWRIVSGSNSVGPYTNGEVGVLTKWWPVVFHAAQ